MIKVLTKNKWIGLTFLAALISKNMDIKIPNRLDHRVAALVRHKTYINCKVEQSNPFYI
jgi:hypothetical protein